ncbi:hypothetical protein LTR37_000494 [Vermiconidia calcicola]|uniref:Uncharacterized protein n=1 Tax=Vermiconidia calcicola TaxID=1690605 RepID=A0ACC3P0K0_9PEZI|nr:hypothetical protein LTR37_000494 [Vermiconidia calcicola]
MSLQPANATKIDRTTTAPFLLRLYWRLSRPLEPHEFSIAPPEDTSAIPSYASLLPQTLRTQSVEIYTWPTCTIAELTGLLSTVLPESWAVGTRCVFKLVFPDTRGGVSESGRGRWVDKPLGSVVIGGREAVMQDSESAGLEDADAANNPGVEILEGDADKTLADARFVIGDYVACTIYPPSQDGRIAPPPSRGPPPNGPRENGGPRGGSGGYRGGGSLRGGPPPPPIGDWRRGERPPPPSSGYGGGGGGGSYRGGGRGGRPY